MNKNINETPNYYAVIPASIRYDNNLKPNEKLLYGEITALCNKNGYCTATNSYFANLYEVENETVSRWIKHLEVLGYISTKSIYKKDSKEIEYRQIEILGTSIKKDLKTYIPNNQEGIDNLNNTPRQNNQEGIDKKVKDNNTSNNISSNSNSYIYNSELENFENINFKKLETDTIKILEKSFSRTISSFEQEEINLLLKEHNSELIIEAIKIATLANKKTIAYIKGILKNWKLKEYKTLNDVYRIERMMEQPPIEIFEYDWLNDEED